MFTNGVQQVHHTRQSPSVGQGIANFSGQIS